jgi:hypothetical protein
MKLKIVIILFLFLTASVQAQRLGIYSMAFYNLENLFDYERDERIFDQDFTPEGTYHWTSEKYFKKLDNLAFVISQLGMEHCPMGPAVIGVAEIENRRVLEDLTQRKELAQRGYGIVHYDSPDRRGIDVALLYLPSLFTVISSRIYNFRMESMPGYTTRDQLLVSGILAGEPVHIIVCHWPSRSGRKKSSALREHAASISKHIVDSLYCVDPNTKIVIMGDLNDDPDDRSCRVVLGEKKTQEKVDNGGLFNAMWELHEKGIGSLSYRGKWNLFDQMIISEPLLGGDYASLKFWRSEIFNRDFLIQKEGRYKGYPLRRFSDNTFANGYSDHFPALIYLLKRVE